jgi:hypothetical protein
MVNLTKRYGCITQRFVPAKEYFGFREEEELTALLLEI